MHLDFFRASPCRKTPVLCGFLNCLLAVIFLWFPCAFLAIQPWFLTHLQCSWLLLNVHNIVFYNLYKMHIHSLYSTHRTRYAHGKCFFYATSLPSVRQHFAMRILLPHFQRSADIFCSQNLASRQCRGVRCAINVNAYDVVSPGLSPHGLLALKS